MDVIKSERDAWMEKIMAAIRSVRRETMLATAPCNAGKPSWESEPSSLVECPEHAHRPRSSTS